MKMNDSMMENEEGLNFDYYYGSEAEQFRFFRIPSLRIRRTRWIYGSWARTTWTGRGGP